MPSGKRARQQRRSGSAVKAPPPVQSKGGGGVRVRQASPKVLMIAAAVVVLAGIGIGLAFALSGGGGGIPSGTPTTGRIDANSLPGAADIHSLYQGIPQHGLTLGKPDAPVTMVMFIDLQCPVCKEFEITAMPTIVKNYIRTGKVKLELKPWAFIGSDSFKARKTLIAASYQNRAFDFAGVLYVNQQPENSGWVTDSMLAQIAASVPGLNVPKVFAAQSSPQTSQIATQVDDLAKTDGVSGTPTILIGAGAQKPKDVTAPGNAPTLQEVTSAIQTALGG